jgi:hypothetical protein
MRPVNHHKRAEGSTATGTANRFKPASVSQTIHPVMNATTADPNAIAMRSKNVVGVRG